MPILTIIAGPNGSGKSTLEEWVELERQGILLDPDAIARSINSENPRSVAIPAGREVLIRIAEYLRREEAFGVETTFSSHASLELIRDAQSRGYEVHLIFVALNTPEKCIERIRIRVARGGHFIPDADVRRRYGRSMANLARAVRIVDIARLYDNSGSEYRLVMSFHKGEIAFTAADLPHWAYACG